jgi:hypothetical protein
VSALQQYAILWTVGKHSKADRSPVSPQKLGPSIWISPVVLDSSIRTCSIGLLLPSVSKDGHGEQGMKAEEGSLP